MHELSIASELVRLAEQAARGAGASRIFQIGLVLGERSGVVREALEFAFEASVEGSLAEGAELVIEERPALLACVTCGSATRPAAPMTMRCSGCGQLARELAAGRELDLVRVECE